MKRPNRAYKRGEPFRDATLFIIACEGAVREREYFEHLGEQSSRIRVKVIEQDGQHRSAPKWVLDSAAKYKTDVGLLDDDQMWIIMDVDRWQEEQLREIQYACINNNNWFLALSNPCFEVWLFLHVDDINSTTASTCQDLKAELPQKIKGGYNKKEFIKNIRAAHERALLLDPNPRLHFMPEPMRTKMHLLTEQIFSVISNQLHF